MQKVVIVVVVIIVLIIGGFMLFSRGTHVDRVQEPANTIESMNQHSESISIESSAFPKGGLIPKKYTCEGDDVNPEVSIQNVPDNTLSLVLIIDDPDALKPAGKVWDHWVVFNMPPTTVHIPENSIPTGVVGRNGSGNNEYEGPCPPDGEHGYFFKIFALDTMLDLPEGSAKAEVEAAMQGHIIDEAQVVGRYNKQ